MNDEASVGGILSGMFRVIGDSSRATLLYVLALGSLSAVGVFLGVVETSEFQAGIGGGFMIDGDSTALTVLFDLAVLAATIVGMYLLLHAQLQSQGRISGEAGSFWLFLGMSIIAMLGVIVGFALLIVPGLVLIARWAAANGFVVGRGQSPVDALKASWEATEGHGWSIFFAGVLLLVGSAIAFAIVLGPLAALSNITVLGVIASYLDAFSDTLSYAFSIAVFCAVTNDHEETAEVFA